MATSKKMYVWTPLTYGDKDGKVQTLDPGEEVSASTIGVDEAEWAQLVESKVVREAKFPDLPDDWTGSPLEYVQRNLREQMALAEDAMSEDDYDLQAVQEAEGVVE